MCPKCEKYLDENRGNEVVVCEECGQPYMMYNSTFKKCEFRKNSKGNIVAFIKGRPVELDSDEEEVIESQEIIRSALPYDGENSSIVRVAMPIKGTEKLLFQ